MSLFSGTFLFARQCTSSPSQSLTISVILRPEVAAVFTDCAAGANADAITTEGNGASVEARAIIGGNCSGTTGASIEACAAQGIDKCWAFAAASRAVAGGKTATVVVVVPWAGMAGGAHADEDAVIRTSFEADVSDTIDVNIFVADIAGTDDVSVHGTIIAGVAGRKDVAVVSSFPLTDNQMHMTERPDE